MHFTIATVASALLALASVATAQDANCSAIIGDYSQTLAGQYKKCYTDVVYNDALVKQGAAPDYKELITSVCSQPACSRSTLTSATTKYIAACNASMDAEVASSSGNILHIGQNALHIFFSEPIRTAFCAEDPNAVIPTPAPVPPVPQYCLSSSISSPSLRYVSNLALFLTTGNVRSTMPAFFEGNGLDPKEVCSPCSQIATNATIAYLSENVMPRIGSFYTPGFVQYWTNLVPAYNKLCNTKFVQTWPKGTLNETVPDVPTGNPTNPVLPTTTSNATSTGKNPTPTGANSAGSLKPAAGAAIALLAALAALL